ncbi:MAG: lipopolysaccharide transport periplasmic protein LptA [Gammaproteobacteria bacterium]|nr:lipopolysaccharide transport periplasmic protein LptA [Gammaproteobacteria bacterium]MDP6615604.1 lipopolysaccharide transport periplasmic protein LptA [Gammaproteobacteria bacterium]MDP6694722.1 lipopolysaccharide transport periplasmic protein LptA [Gammaproteobacteria bacterium]
MLLITGLSAVQAVCAQEDSKRDNSDEPITIDADSSEFDYESDKLLFRGLRLDQGTLGIQADLAEAAKLDFEEGSWTFSGNVVVESDEATLYCDYARFLVADNELVEAELTGSPARFEQFIKESGKLNSGEAKRIIYRLDTDTLQLSDDARFTDGTNEISSDLITYDLEEKHLTADSGDTGPVKILIEPPDKESDTKETP